MQVQDTSRLLRRISEYRQLLDYAEQKLHKEAFGIGKLICKPENRNYFGVTNVMNLSHLSIGVKYLRLKWRKLDHMARKVGGARNIFCELFGHHKAENTFWLDSSSKEKVAC